MFCIYAGPCKASKPFLGLRTPRLLGSHTMPELEYQWMKITLCVVHSRDHVIELISTLGSLGIIMWIYTIFQRTISSIKDDNMDHTKCETRIENM